MPRFFIISGCNGAGKTTASYTVLPERLQLRTFVNADEIADELSPIAVELSPQEQEKNSIRASRLMMERMDQLIERGDDFAVETTLATKSLAGTVLRAQQQGYTVGLYYFWLKSDDLAVKRVGIRVASGGHDVPEATIRRRYRQGMENLRSLYLPRCDSWVLVDNSADDGRIIAEQQAGEPVRIYNRRLYNLILNIEPNEP